MANLTKTLKTQVVDHFGPSPSTKWNNFKWTLAGVGPGNGTWGMKSAACLGTSSILKKIFRTLSHSSMNIGISCPTASVFKTVNKIHSHTMTVSYANTDKEQSDGRGYLYVFPDRVTNAEHQFIESFTCSVAGSTTYTSAVAASTTWR